jgi:NitT/TauT family transport system ATP-binding protein
MPGTANGRTECALQDELTRVWNAFGKTVVFVTHDIDEAVYLADRVVARGGKPGEVKASLSIDVPRPRARHDYVLQAMRSESKTNSAWKLS